jgi:hypothetical protein
MRVCLCIMGVLLCGCSVRSDRATVFREALAGDDDALQREFARAEVRMNEPLTLAGEDIQALYLEYKALLEKLGDKRFAAALSRQSPRVRAAVREFVPDLNRYPATRQVLFDTPSFDFPAASPE